MPLLLWGYWLPQKRTPKVFIPVFSFIYLDSIARLWSWSCWFHGGARWWLAICEPDGALHLLPQSSGHKSQRPRNRSWHVKPMFQHALFLHSVRVTHIGSHRLTHPCSSSRLRETATLTAGVEETSTDFCRKAGQNFSVIVHGSTLPCITHSYPKHHSSIIRFSSQ